MDFKSPTDAPGGQVPQPEGLKSSKPSNSNHEAPVDEKPKFAYNPVVPVKPLTVGGGAKNGKKWIIIAVSVLVIVLAIAAGAFGYFYYTSEAPEAIIGQAFINMSELNSVAYEASVDISVTVIETDLPFVEIGQKQKINLSTAGEFDNASVPKSQGTLGLTFNGAVASLASGEYGAEFGFVSVDKDVYLQLVDLVFPSLIAQMLPIDLDMIKGQWIGVNASDSPVNVPVSDLNNLTDDDQTALMEIYKEYQVLNIVEVTDGEDMKRFKIKIDGPKLSAAIERVKEVVLEDQTIDFPPEAMSYIEKIDISLWVGNSDKMIHQAQVLFNDRIDENDVVLDLNINALIKYSRFGESFNIVAPTNVITAEQLVEMVTTSMMSDVESTDSLEDRDTDNDGISDWLELSLGMDPMELDSDGDGFTDKDEFALGYNPIGEGRLWEVGWSADKKRNILFEINQYSVVTLNEMTDEEVEDLYTTVLQEIFGADMLED
jgi:hypothetical protein